MNRAGLISAVLVLAACASSAHAGYASPPPFMSIELLVAQSTAIVRGTITAADVNFIDCTLEIAEIYKGGIVGKRLDFEMAAENWIGGPRAELQGKAALFFLTQTPKGIICKGVLPLDGSAITLTLHLEVISTPQAIMAATKEAILEGPHESFGKLDDRGLWLNLAGLPTGVSDERGPCTSVVLPNDNRLLRRAAELLQSDEKHHRLWGVRILHAMYQQLPFLDQPAAARLREALRTMGAVQLLRSRLSDDGLDDYVDSNWKWSHRWYWVRSEAIDALKGCGQPVPDIEIRGLLEHYHPISRAWVAAPTYGLFLTLCLLWKRSRRLTLPAILLLAIGTTTWLWYRSYRTIDELMFPVGAHHHEVASYRGGVQYGIVRDCTSDWDQLRRILVGHIRYDPANDYWGAPDPQDGKRTSRMGFAIQTGVTTGPETKAGPNTWPYFMLRVPYWFMLTMLLMPLLMTVRRPLRKWIRDRNGQCLACGYDLRASPAKCPECGRDR
jgi:hypothetical protein